MLDRFIECEFFRVVHEPWNSVLWCSVHQGQIPKAKQTLMLQNHKAQDHEAQLYESANPEVQISEAQISEKLRSLPLKEW